MKKAGTSSSILANFYESSVKFTDFCLTLQIDQKYLQFLMLYKLKSRNCEKEIWIFESIYIRNFPIMNEIEIADIDQEIRLHTR